MRQLPRVAAALVGGARPGQSLRNRSPSDASLCPAIQPHKLLFAPGFGALKAYLPTRLLLLADTCTGQLKELQPIHLLYQGFPCLDLPGAELLACRLLDVSLLKDISTQPGPGPNK